VKLLEGTGTAQAQGRRGSPYLDIAPGGSALALGGTMTVTLTFRAPAGQRLQYTARLLDGVGPR
jgi:hypothetical protein